MISGMIQSLTVSCTPIHFCSKDDGKAASEIACDEMLIIAVQVLCKFTVLVSQQSHSDQSLNGLDTSQMRFWHSGGDFSQLKILMSSMAKVDVQLAIESHQISE